MKMIKVIVKKVVGKKNQGRLDFCRHLVSRYSWGAPFNGQRFRQRIFADLLYFLPIKAIVETGTWRGTTTALFGTTSLPVYTSEIDPLYFSYAKMRLCFNRANIHLYYDDSCSFLRKISEDTSVAKENVFFYLDAHWGECLPLQEELDIIFSKWKSPIVMIDDFQVPNSDYLFDDYGLGKTLNRDYIKSIVSAHNLSVFFPAVKASSETGGRRGSVVLCQEMLGLEVDAKIKTLVRDTVGR